MGSSWDGGMDWQCLMKFQNYKPKLLPFGRKILLEWHHLGTESWRATLCTQALGAQWAERWMWASSALAAEMASSLLDAIEGAEPLDQGLTAVHGKRARNSRCKLEHSRLNLNTQMNILPVRAAAKRGYAVYILIGFQKATTQVSQQPCLSTCLDQKQPGVPSSLNFPVFKIVLYWQDLGLLCFWKNSSVSLFNKVRGLFNTFT